MTREELLTKLRGIVEQQQLGNHDWEDHHSNADTLLLLYINDSEIAGVYDTIEKWYA